MEGRFCRPVGAEFDQGGLNGSLQGQVEAVDICKMAAGVLVHNGTRRMSDHVFDSLQSIASCMHMLYLWRLCEV